MYSRTSPVQNEVKIMCRNIKPLFNFEPGVTEEEVRAASLQFVRKISGFNKPSKANAACNKTSIRQNRAPDKRPNEAKNCEAKEVNTHHSGWKGYKGANHWQQT